MTAPADRLRLLADDELQDLTERLRRQVEAMRGLDQAHVEPYRLALAEAEAEIGRRTC
jgi:hypothetical protein